MSDQGQLATLTITSNSFQLQPAPTGRNAKVPTTSKRSKICTVASPLLKSVFEDDTLSARSTVVLSPLPQTATPRAGEFSFAQTMRRSSCTVIPRRTLMRSISSSCLPVSPTVRKRLAWQGFETVIPISPRSPLSPATAHKLHTPTIASSLAAFAGPLSATLKTLGAKRHSQTFLRTNVVQKQVLEHVHQPAHVLLLPQHFNQKNTSVLLDDVLVDRPKSGPTNTAMAEAVPEKVHFVQRPAIATLRAKPNYDLVSDQVTGMVTALRDYKAEHRFSQLPDDESRRDGWGGILARLSWFIRHTPGPLVSSQPNRLKSLQLVPASFARLSTRVEPEEWEDIDDKTVDSSTEQSSIIAPRFRFPQPKTKRSKRFRFRKQHASHASLREKLEQSCSTSVLISDTASVPKRPASTSLTTPRILVCLLVLALLASAIVNIVLIAR